MEVIRELLQDIELPRMVKVRQKFEAPEIEDIQHEVNHAMKSVNVLSKIQPGDQVAIAVGSRGVADIPLITKEVVDAVREAGGDPFVVPAMGSHGGATGEGQKSVLEHLGVTEEYIGAPIRSSMDVKQIGQLENGLPVYFDRHAFDADKVIVINRIKPHTAFRGEFESGLLKMITIGLGKQKGAEAAHSYGFKYMAEHIPEMARIAIEKCPIIFGLATIENAYDRPAKIIAIPSERLLVDEPALLLEAKGLMPRIKFDPLDVLVVEELGKDISGDGMDPNISGRFATPYAKGGASASRVAVLKLTDKTHGNANGIGLGDVTTKDVFDSIDLVKGYANALTSTVVETVKIPMILETEELAIKAAIKTCNAFDLTTIRMVRIKNTLDLQEIWISESLVSEAKSMEDIDLLEDVTSLS